MKPWWPKPTVRRLLVLIALVALSFWIADQWRLAGRSGRYRRIAAHADVMERHCREVVAMDDATRKRRAGEAWDDPYLHDPDRARRMIPYFRTMRARFGRAAERPRLPVDLHTPPP